MSENDEITRHQSKTNKRKFLVAAGESDDIVKEITRYREKIKELVQKLKYLEENENNIKNKEATSSSIAKPSDADMGISETNIPEHSVPIQADVKTYDWRQLHDKVQFDVIMMDPPWQLATANPTRGVALSYRQLLNQDIMALPIDKLQTNGLLFIWVINYSFDFAVSLFEHWGYKIIDEVVWVKLTVNCRLAKSHGFYLQHAKEMCLVGLKGKGPEKLKCGTDVILSKRRGQSQKPEEIYELIEDLVPDGKYLEIFARRNNLRNFWVSLGNEIFNTDNNI